jgi:hypothetical protein
MSSKVVGPGGETAIAGAGLLMGGCQRVGKHCLGSGANWSSLSDVLESFKWVEGLLGMSMMVMSSEN